MVMVVLVLKHLKHEWSMNYGGVDPHVADKSRNYFRFSELRSGTSQEGGASRNFLFPCPAYRMYGSEPDSAD